MSDDDDDDDGIPCLPPESAGRCGPPPELMRFPNRLAELHYIIARCRKFAEDGVPWSDIAILCRTKKEGERLATALEAADLPLEWCNCNSASRRYKPSDPSIKRNTMHSSKGLEFPVVLMPAVDHEFPATVDEVRLMYVAMTRAIERLFLTYKRETSVVRMLERAIARRAKREQQQGVSTTFRKTNFQPRAGKSLHLRNARRIQ